jgi:hypothetical protein
VLCLDLMLTPPPLSLPQTSWALRLLCEDDKTRDAVAEAGGVSALITLCEASTQRVVLEEATRALKALTQES